MIIVSILTGDDAAHYKLQEEIPLRDTPYELHYYDSVVELGCDEEQPAEQAEKGLRYF